jgi:mono/diheme cytochrome c family protein
MMRLPFRLLLAFAVAAAGTRAPGQGPAFPRTADTMRLLEGRCIRCHDKGKSRGGLELTTRANLLRGGESGPAVVPGQPDRSLLIRLVTHADEPAMPQNGAKLADAQIALLADWIKAGAPYDRTLGKGDDTVWWSLRPVTRPAPPQIADARYADWQRNPIDRFVLAKLLEKGLKPSPPADRRTLIRRLTFDLHGLPPTPEEIDAFLRDASPQAYERLVDRLLTSPRYGERWARHWMDVVHFAETHGHDQDVPRDNAWPYRDYLIDSFNADKPYARFVEEQIAGDVLFPDDPRATVALGFLAAGPWDESSLKDIREDSLDRKAGQYLDRDDMVGTVGLALLSTTVQCARCHDHKFDPVSQKEYYGLQAVFAGVDRADRPYDADPRERARRLALQRRRQQVRAGGAKLLDDPATAAEVAAWEKRVRGGAAWRVLDPVAFTSAEGSTLTRRPDGSLLAAGKRPETDTYTIEAIATGAPLTAIRLEVLSDPSLPKQGPGRQDNGNLHLSEFKIEVASLVTPKAGEGPRSSSPLRNGGEGSGLRGRPGQRLAIQPPRGAAPSPPAPLPQRERGDRRPVAIARAVADFNQAGWEIEKALDGKRETAWGIFPQVGQSHSAVFHLKEPLPAGDGVRLVVTLSQLHGGGHLIGRPRLSVTSAASPAAVEPVPPKIERIVAKPADRRDAGERAELARFALLAKIDADLAALPPPRLVYAAASDFVPQGSFRPAKGCRPVHVLRRGDVKQPLALATPGGLACVAGLDATFQLADPASEGQRRAALAKWVSDPRNPLTWRSIVNRAWQLHFGRGLVATPSDFGRMGAKPTHPELLDWLTAAFQDDGGSLKKLHRRIVTSAAYRQASRFDADAARIDADNAYLWRMNVARLDAESARDAVLHVAGQLDPTMGGPSVKHFVQSPGIHRTPKVDYAAYDPDSPGAHRRSIYRFIFRTVPDPFMDALDCPDASQFTAVRPVSVTALQALALLNDPFMVRMSEHFAKRLAPAGDVRARVRRAYRLALGRDPRPAEESALAEYAGRHGLANACRVLLNCNEFVFVP